MSEEKILVNEEYEEEQEVQDKTANDNGESKISIKNVEKLTNIDEEEEDQEIVEDITASKDEELEGQEDMTVNEENEFPGEETVEYSEDRKLIQADNLDEMTTDKMTETTQIQEDVEEESLSEYEEGEHLKEDKSIEIEIPDLNQDVSDLSDLDLPGDFTKKVEKEKSQSLLSSDGDSQETKIKTDFEEEEFTYDDEEEIISEYETEGHTEDDEKDYFEKPIKKKVEISAFAEDASSDSDAFLRFIEDQDQKEETKKVEVEADIDIGLESGVSTLLEQIVEQVVEKSEQYDPDDLLRAKLDRMKVIRGFKVATVELREENKKRSVLHSKVIAYFRKKKYARALSEENPDTLPEVIQRYRELLCQLDTAKAFNKALQLQIDATLNYNENKEYQLRKTAEKSVEKLNKTIKDIGLVSTSLKTGQLLPAKTIDGIINKMNIMRNQISEMRLQFIKMQHNIATLMNEARKLEDIGNGLKMIDFEQLRAETQGLGDKLEERNNELSKLRNRCNADTHVLAHIREKQAIQEKNILLQKEKLASLRIELHTNRNYVNSLKVERDILRKKYNEYSHDCGLLDKPSLLHDYDNTVHQINEIKERIHKLKEIREKLLHQLDNIIMKLEN